MNTKVKKPIDQTEESKNWVIILLLVIGLFFLIIGLFYDAQRDRNEALQNEKQALIQERNRILQFLKEKEALLLKAEIRFKWVYPLSRYLIILTVIIINLGTCTLFHIDMNIGSFVDINSLLLLLLLGLNYALYGEITDLREINGNIKEKIKNLCFKENLSLKDDIYTYNKQKDIIETKLQKIEDELKKFST